MNQFIDFIILLFLQNSSFQTMILNAVFYLCLIPVFLAKISIENQIDLSKLSDFSSSYGINVIVESEWRDTSKESGLQLIQLNVKYSHRNKKKAYNTFLQIKNLLIEQLMRKHLLPSKQLLKTSEISQKYHQKSKKWQFYQIFVVYCDPNNLYDVLQKLNKKGIQKIKSTPDITVQSHQLILLGAFIQAKQQLEKFLKNDLKQALKIISIENFSFTSEKESFLVTNEQIKGQKSKKEGKNFIEQFSNERQGSTKIKVTFKIGFQQEQDESIAESISCFSEEE